jgi:hypothetical protein
MRARPATPPTTPPAIAPALDFFPLPPPSEDPGPADSDGSPCEAVAVPDVPRDEDEGPAVLCGTPDVSAGSVGTHCESVLHRNVKLVTHL